MFVFKFMLFIAQQINYKTKKRIKRFVFKFGAEDEIRTRDICLGKATLYH